MDMHTINNSDGAVQKKQIWEARTIVRALRRRKYSTFIHEIFWIASHCVLLKMTPMTVTLMRNPKLMMNRWGSPRSMRIWAEDIAFGDKSSGCLARSVCQSQLYLDAKKNYFSQAPRLRRGGKNTFKWCFDSIKTEPICEEWDKSISDAFWKDY